MRVLAKKITVQCLLCFVAHQAEANPPYDPPVIPTFFVRFAIFDPATSGWQGKGKMELPF